MTVILPENYHAQKQLEARRIDCISQKEALRQDIRALRIGILNIMPRAERYELNILFSLGRSVMQIHPIWIRLETHQYKSSDREHMNHLYLSFREAIKERHLDGLILTGAPVGKLEFKEISYWQEIQKILDYARRNITGTLGICWGGVALANVMGLKRKNYGQKLFGVYEGANLDRGHPITGELDDVFNCPQSRYVGLDEKDMEAAAKRGEIRLLAKGEEAGYFIFESGDGRYLAHLGHPEYNSRRLVEEAERDRAAGLKDVGTPYNFDLTRPQNRWRGHRNEFFTQWIKYIYTQTEY